MPISSASTARRLKLWRVSARITSPGPTLLPALDPAILHRERVVMTSVHEGVGTGAAFNQMQQRKCGFSCSTGDCPPHGGGAICLSLLARAPRTDSP